MCVFGAKGVLKLKVPQSLTDLNNSGKLTFIAIITKPVSLSGHKDKAFYVVLVTLTPKRVQRDKKLNESLILNGQLHLKSFRCRHQGDLW